METPKKVVLIGDKYININKMETPKKVVLIGDKGHPITPSTPDKVASTPSPQRSRTLFHHSSPPISPQANARKQLGRNLYHHTSQSNARKQWLPPWCCMRRIITDNLLTGAITAIILFIFHKQLQTANNSSHTTLVTHHHKNNSDHSQHHVCEHNEEGIQTNGTCYKLLYPAVKSKPAWYFLGDSQMNMLVENMNYPYEIHTSRLPDKDHPTWGRCDLLNYYFLERSANWTPPAMTVGGTGKIQGPTKYGLKIHYCLDASGPYNRQFASSSLNFMDYLAVEYGSDVEHQSTITNTSQESAVHYMQWQLDELLLTREDAVCVVNTGIHDQRLCPGLGNEDTCLDVYTNNVKSYLQLLNSTCGKMLWLSITSVRGDEGPLKPQRNFRSIIWNQRILKTLANEYPDNSYFIDVWNASLRGVRNSNIHFEAPYYIKLGELFSSLM